MGGVGGLPLLLDQLVHVMLRPVLGGGHLEHVGGAEQSLLRVPVGDHLQTDIVKIKSKDGFVILPVRL
mgnify:FL=1